MFTFIDTSGRLAMVVSHGLAGHLELGDTLMPKPIRRRVATMPRSQ